MQTINVLKRRIGFVPMRVIVGPECPSSRLSALGTSTTAVEVFLQLDSPRPIPVCCLTALTSEAATSRSAAKFGRLVTSTASYGRQLYKRLLLAFERI